MERVRILLYSSGLPTKFWAKTVACGSHVSNVTPRKNKAKTPHELFFNVKPNVSYLRIFGCTVYCHIPKKKRNKLELPGKIGIMVGYSRERRGYRIYDPEKEIVLEESRIQLNSTNYLLCIIKIILLIIRYLTFQNCIRSKQADY